MAKSKKQKKKQQKKQAKQYEKEIQSLLDTEIEVYGGIFGDCTGCAEDVEGLWDFLQSEGTGTSVAIHFLPHMINLYVSERGNLHATEGTLRMVDNDNNFVEIYGNIVMTELSSLTELDSVKERYRLNETNLPIVTTKVRPI